MDNIINSITGFDEEYFIKEKLNEITDECYIFSIEKKKRT